MITLQSLIRLQDGTYYAKWLDADDNCPDAAHTIAAIHGPDGRSQAANFNIRAPRLTAEQMAEAQPDQHRAYELAALGTAKQPRWANRYQKAAELVEAGQVRLTGPETAVVSSSQDYTIDGDKCPCKWSQFNATPCSHYLAVRMARALGQPIQPLTEAERDAACDARIAAAREAKIARVANRGENQYYKDRRQARRDGDGARQWARMAYANGGTTIPADIWQRAQGGD